MEREEITKKILANNAEIQALFSPVVHVLNEKIAALIAENKALQENCEHEYDGTGSCYWCFFQKRGD